MNGNVPRDVQCICVIICICTQATIQRNNAKKTSIHCSIHMMWCWYCVSRSMSAVWVFLVGYHVHCRNEITIHTTIRMIVTVHRYVNIFSMKLACVDKRMFYCWINENVDLLHCQRSLSVCTVVCAIFAL